LEDRSKRRARLILIVGVLLAGLAAAGTFFLASSNTTATTVSAPTTEVLVASREIPQRTTITAGDLRVVKMNTDVVPASAIRAEQQKDVVGKVNVVPIATGEVILLSKFGGSADKVFTVFPPNVPLTAGQALPPGTPNYRAFSITVPDQFAVGGAILAGDIVDIMYTMNIDPTQRFIAPQGIVTGSPQDTRTADFSAKIVIERVPIIARTLAVYTIRTDAETAERLGYLQAAGAQIHMLLRASQDDRVVRSNGATFGQVYQWGRFQAPAKISPVLP
jgi:Flp pilus assembly protein CpaB